MIFGKVSGFYPPRFSMKQLTFADGGYAGKSK